MSVFLSRQRGPLYCNPQISTGHLTSIEIKGNTIQNIKTFFTPQICAKLTIDGAPCQPTPATVAFQTSKNLIPTNTQNNYTQTTAPDLVPAIQVQPSSSGTYDVSFNVYVTKSNNHTGSDDPSFNAIACVSSLQTGGCSGSGVTFLNSVPSSFV